MAEPPKAIIYTSVATILGWHIWTILSLSGTIVLLYLNFHNVFLGSELGGTMESSANILGFLQIVVKAHELCIIASIVAIAEQHIMRDLLGDGLLLCLLGAQGALASPSFLISTRFRLATKFGFRSFYPGRSSVNSNRRVHLRTLRLVVLIFFSGVIAALAGPSSAVLMVPRVGWFLHRAQRHMPVPRSTIPTVLLGTAPGVLGGEGTMESNPFAFPDVVVGAGLQYWMNISMGEFHDPGILMEKKSTHPFHDGFGMVYMQTFSTENALLASPWTPGTKTRAEVKMVNLMYEDGSWIVPPAEFDSKKKDLKVDYETHGVEATTRCRARSKIPCSVDSTISEDPPYPHWCYLTVNSDPTTVGELRKGQNLLMASEFQAAVEYPRVWLTEGPASTKTVCSFSAVLVSALATTYGTELISQSIIYHDYVSTNGTTLPPRRFLFHENWLDRAYSYDPTLSLSDAILNPENFNSTAYNVGTTYNSTSWSFPTGSMVHPDNFTYPARPGMFPQRNSFGRLGASLVHAVGHPNLDSKGREMDTSFRAEATVGGILTYMLTWSLPSFSQYSMPYDQIPEKFRLGPPQSFPHQYDAKYYVSGYGYRLSNRTGILGVVVLVSHAVLATAASVWQLLRRRGIMQAWSTVPDYVCLGSGSSSVVATHPNTCAGIAGEDGLCSVVRIVETARDEQAEKDGSTPHLEVMAVQRVVTTGALEVDLGDDKKKYGFTERKHKSE